MDASDDAWANDIVGNNGRGRCGAGSGCSVPGNEELKGACGSMRGVGLDRQSEIEYTAREHSESALRVRGV